jgi:hypothetical protein
MDMLTCHNLSQAVIAVCGDDDALIQIEAVHGPRHAGKEARALDASWRCDFNSSLGCRASAAFAAAGWSADEARQPKSRRTSVVHSPSLTLVTSDTENGAGQM